MSSSLWGVNPEVLKRATQPLSFEETDLVARLYRKRGELTDGDTFIAIAKQINSSTRAAFGSQFQVTSLNVKTVIERLQKLAPFWLLNNPADELPDGFDRCAAPLVKNCLQCGGALQQTRCKGDTFFYHHTKQPTVGVLYRKRCQSCDITYELDGYYCSSATSKSLAFNLA